MMKSPCGSYPSRTYIVEKLTGNVPDDSNEAQVMVRRWLVLSRELQAARAGGAKSVAMRVEFDTTLPKKILKDMSSYEGERPGHALFNSAKLAGR
jgi:hypothetical protein